MLHTPALYPRLILLLPNIVVIVILLSYYTQRFPQGSSLDRLEHGKDDGSGKSRDISLNAQAPEGSIECVIQEFAHTVVERRRSHSD
jgi:hypothetical protein